MDYKESCARMRAGKFISLQDFCTLRNIEMGGIISITNPLDGNVVEYECVFYPLATKTTIDGNCPFIVDFNSDGSQIVSIRADWVEKDCELISRKI